MSDSKKQSAADQSVAATNSAPTSTTAADQPSPAKTIATASQVANQGADPADTPIASKWNARYAYANQSIPAPADVLINGAAFLPDSGTALDIACGRGGNAFHLARKGFTVQAWDISSTAIDYIQEQLRSQTAGLELLAAVRDVVNEPPEINSVDLIVVSRFLDRGLCAKLSDALRPGGVLFYQTFTAGLSNPNYLLKPNELPMLFAELSPCYSYESPLNVQGFSEAQFVGRKS